MKNKNFKSYLIIWFACLVGFNIIVFAIPNEIFGINRFDMTSFWIIYSIVSITFIGQLLTTLYAIKATTNEKLFYRIPIIRVGLICLLSETLLGLVFMILTIIPSWISLLVCSIAFLTHIIYCVLSFSASKNVESINARTKNKIKTFKDLTAEAETLCSYAESEIAKKETEKIFELFRYSDFVSFGDTESILNSFKHFSGAIKTNNDKEILKFSNELSCLIKERSIKEKSSK